VAHDAIAGGWTMYVVVPAPTRVAAVLGFAKELERRFAFADGRQTKQSFRRLGRAAGDAEKADSSPIILGLFVKSCG
jgi:hypothetical protein